MGRFDALLGRLEQQAENLPGKRTLAEEIELQELVVGACYGVREVAQDLLARPFRQWDATAFADSAETDLAVQLRHLRELTQDDPAAWEARLQRVQAKRAEPKRRLVNYRT